MSKQQGNIKDIVSPSQLKEEALHGILPRLNLMEQPMKESLDLTARLVSKLFNMPLTVISLSLDDKVQFLSCIDQTCVFNGKNSMHKKDVFCDHVIKSGKPLIIADALEEHLFLNTTLTTSYLIRFYAGVPIFSANKTVIGTLALMDTKPRSFSGNDLAELIHISKMLNNEIDLNWLKNEKESLEDTIRAVYEITNDPSLSFSCKINRLLDIGRQHFQLPNGFIHSMIGNNFRIVATTIEKQNEDIQNCLLKSYLEVIVKTNRPLSLNNEQSLNLKTQFLNAFLGAPILVNGKVYGTITFSSDQIPCRKLSNGDLNFLLIISQWIGNQIEHLQTMTELEESKQLLPQIAETSKLVFWIYDSSIKKVLYISPAWEEIWGRTCEEYYQNPMIWDDSLHPDDKVIMVNRLQMIYKSSEFEYRIVTPEQRIKWIRDRIVPIYDSNGKLNRLAGIAEDITELKVKEDLLRKSDKLAAVGHLAASFAHEIRNPLTSIKGFLQLQKDKIEPYSEIIQSELNRIESIIKEFLMLAKPHQDTAFEINDLKKIVQDVIMLIESQANLYNITFSLQLPNNPLFVYCEKNQIKQVLINIINNAIDAMIDGGKIEIMMDFANQNTCFIKVKDEGIGISEDRLTKLGEPFFSNKEKGTGLGLMVSYKIVENHNGQITINSKLNKGTIVTLELPINQG